MIGSKQCLNAQNGRPWLSVWRSAVKDVVSVEQQDRDFTVPV